MSEKLIGVPEAIAILSAMHEGGDGPHLGPAVVASYVADSQTDDATAYLGLIGGLTNVCSVLLSLRQQEQGVPVRDTLQMLAASFNRSGAGD